MEILQLQLSKLIIKWWNFSINVDDKRFSTMSSWYSETPRRFRQISPLGIWYETLSKKPIKMHDDNAKGINVENSSSHEYLSEIIHATYEHTRIRASDKVNSNFTQ